MSQLLRQICNLLLEVMFHLGETRDRDSICAKIASGQPQYCQFSVVCLEEAGPDTEQQDALSLTGWIVITLSVIRRCVKHGGLCKSVMGSRER